ncbi:molybdenum cofactor guanylyltransferase [Candidatus Aerophobetes bacterium]|nr:molybdenum cofactor guanylyltransferase [Candidatus Aerophobetes bacterium]
MTGIILAGGKGRRIGGNKAFLKIGNKPLIELVIERLKTIFDNNIIIVTNNPYKFSSLGIKIIKDVVHNKGPLGGIYTGLLFSKSKYNFICACDMPFLNLSLLRFIISQIEDNDVIVPLVGNFAQPLHSIYSKKCLGAIRRKIENRELKITRFFSEVKYRYLPESLIRKYDPHLSSFLNLNTLEKLKLARENFISW